MEKNVIYILMEPVKEGTVSGEMVIGKDKIVKNVNEEIAKTVNEGNDKTLNKKAVEGVNVDIETGNIGETANEIARIKNRFGITSNKGLTNSRSSEPNQYVSFHKNDFKCNLCDFETIMFKTLVNHLEAVHDIHKTGETLQFNSYQQFKEWKDKTEQETNSSCMRNCDTKKKTKSDIYHHYNGKFKSMTSAGNEVIVSLNKMHASQNLDIKRVPVPLSDENTKIAQKQTYMGTVNEVVNEEFLEPINEIIVETVNEEIVETDDLVVTVNEDQINHFNHRCSICNENFTNSTNVYGHICKIHSPNFSFQKNGIKCSLCKFKTVMFKMLFIHLEAKHNIQIITETLRFNSYKKFKDWKEKKEQETNSLFMRKCVTKKKAKSEEVYYCHHNGEFKSKRQKKINLKAIGINEINSACPANMKVTVNTDGKVIVFFTKTHVGHSLNVEQVLLSVEEKKENIETVNENIVETVIEEIVETTNNMMETVNEEIVENVNYSIVEGERHKVVKIVDDLIAKTISGKFADSIGQVNNEETLKTVNDKIMATVNEEIVGSVTGTITKMISNKFTENINVNYGEVNNEETMRTASDKIMKTLNNNMEAVSEKVGDSLNNKMVEVANEIVEIINDELVQSLIDQIVKTVSDKLVETVNENIVETVNEKIVETVNENIVKTPNEKIVENINKDTLKTVPVSDKIVEIVYKMETEKNMDNVNEEINQFAHPCDMCNESFTNSIDLNQHVLEIHQKKKNFHKSSVKCSLCNFETIIFKILVSHLVDEHDILMISDILEFNSDQQFKNWKEKMEEETNSLFLRKCGTKKKVNSEVSYYYCHRSGEFKSRSQGKRNLKAMGTNKINAACPANMKVTTNTKGEVTVFFTKTHVGHTLDIDRVPLSTEVKKEIAENLSQNIPVKEILHDINNSVDTNFKRKHLLTKCDVLNINKSFHFSEENMRLNDAVSTLDTQGNKQINLSCQVEKLQPRNESTTTMDHKYANGTSAYNKVGTVSALERESLVSKQDSFQDGLAKLSNGFANLCQRVKTTEDCHKMLHLLSCATTLYNNYQEEECIKESANKNIHSQRLLLKQQANKNIEPQRLFSKCKKRTRKSTNILCNPLEPQQDIIIISINQDSPVFLDLM